MEQPIMVCARYGTTGHVAEGSTRAVASCGHDVWLSAAGAEIAEEKNCRLVCHQCGEALARENPDEVEIAALTEKQIRELEAAGLDTPTPQQILDFLLGRWKP